MANTRGVSQFMRNRGKPAAAVAAAPRNRSRVSQPEAINKDNTPTTSITPIAGLAPDSRRITNSRPASATRNRIKVIAKSLCLPWIRVSGIKAGATSLTLRYAELTLTDDHVPDTTPDSASYCHQEVRSEERRVGKECGSRWWP